MVDEHDMENCNQRLTNIHLHRKATSRTVFSGSNAAIFIYLVIDDSDAYLNRITNKLLRPRKKAEDVQSPSLTALIGRSSKQT